MASLKEIGDLQALIAMHYPAFQKQIIGSDGKQRRDIAEEWLRIIGYLDYKDLIDRLDAYMDSDISRKPPMAVDFKKVKANRVAGEVWSGPDNFDRIDSKGRLTDAEGRLYAFPQAPDEVYHYNAEGRIADSKGNVVR